MSGRSTPSDQGQEKQNNPNKSSTVHRSPFGFAKLLACVWFLSRTINFFTFFQTAQLNKSREEAKKFILNLKKIGIRK